MHATSLLGQTFLKENKFNEAQIHLSNARHLADSLDLKWEKANTALLVAELYHKKMEYASAVAYGKKAMAESAEIASLYILQRSNNIIARSLLELNKIKETRQQFEAFESVYDSLIASLPPDIYDKTIGANNLVEEARTYEHIQNELSKLTADAEQRKLIFYGLLFSILMVVIILFLILRSNFIKTRNYLELTVLNTEVQTQKNHLETVNKNLDNINKEKDALLGMVAHDIRSPLNKISGLINILKLENKLGPEHDHIVEIVEKTVKEANMLVNELLEINRIDSGSLEVHAETFDFKNFVEDILFFFRKVAEEKSIGILLQFDDDAQIITTDKKILQRIVENLLSNAIKYSYKGSDILIKINKGAELIITVKDQGTGVAEEEHKNLFMKFGKTSSIPTDGETSNGLGLYIVNRLTTALDGRISFVSKLGEGSEFTIHLPIREDT